MQIFMRNVLRLFLAAFCSITMVFPQTPKPTSGAGVPNTDDIEPLIQRFNVGPKSEFETKAQYEARTKIAVEAGKRYAFVYDENGPTCYVAHISSVQYCIFECDAEAGVMQARLQIEDKSIPDGADKRSYVLIKKVSRTHDLRGESTFGTPVRYASWDMEDYGVVLSKDDAVWLRSSFGNTDRFNWMSAEQLRNLLKSGDETLTPTFRVRLDSEQARDLKQALCMVLVGSIPDAHIISNHNYYEAKLTDRNEMSIDRSYLNFVLSEVRIVDGRSGKALAAFSKKP